MKSAIIFVLLFIIAQTNSFSWPEIFLPEDDSLGKLISDVVTDIRDTIDCTVLSVERALSLDGLFETSPEYEEKCRGERSYTETSDTSWPNNQYAKGETSIQPGNNDNQKQISEIDVSVSSVSTQIQSVIEDSSKNETTQNVKDSLKTESDRLSQISAVFKKEVDKIPQEVRKKFKINSDEISVDDIVEEVKLLYEYEIEQSDKSNEVVHEVRRIFYEVLTVLNVTDLHPPLSEEEEVKLILTNIYKHSNHSLVDVEKQISTWTKEGKRQITNIKNVLINVNQDINSVTNKTNNNTHSSKDVTNEKSHEAENHKNKTSLCSVDSKDNTERANVTQAASDDCGQTINKASVGEKRNVTSLSHRVTSFTIHKSNTTSMDVVHNETRVSSTDKSQNHHSATLTESKKSASSQFDSEKDPVISKLLTIAETATKKENKSPLQTFTRSLYAKNLHFNQTGEITTRQPKVFPNSSAEPPLSAKLSKHIYTRVKISSPPKKIVAEVTNTQADSPKTKFSEAPPLTKSSTRFNKVMGPLVAMKNSQLSTQINSSLVNISSAPSALPKQSRTNISTTGKKRSDDTNSISTLLSSTKTDSASTPAYTINQPDSTRTSSTERQFRENVEIFDQAPSPQDTTTVKSAETEQFPKNFRDVTQQILDKSKTDTQNSDSKSSASGKFYLGALKQLFGPTANDEQREAVHDAESIIEGSLKSQDFVNSLSTDTKSEPNIFDDPDYF